MHTGVMHICAAGAANIPEAVRRVMKVRAQDRRPPDFSDRSLVLSKDLKFGVDVWRMARAAAPGLRQTDPHPHPGQIAAIRPNAR